MTNIVFLILAGVAGGILAGMGMGGGTLTIPILVLLLGVGQLTAQFVNLAAFLPSGAVALGLHVKNGLVEIRGLPFILFPAAAATALTSALAFGFEEILLEKMFGGFLVAVGVLSLCAGALKKAG